MPGSSSTSSTRKPSLLGVVAIVDVGQHGLGPGVHHMGGYHAVGAQRFDLVDPAAVMLLKLDLEYLADALAAQPLQHLVQRHDLAALQRRAGAIMARLARPREGPGQDPDQERQNHEHAHELGLECVVGPTADYRGSLLNGS